MELIILLITPLFAALLSFFAAASVSTLNRTALAAVGIELVAVAMIAGKVAHNGTFAPDATPFSVDALGAIFLLVIGVVGAATAWYSVGYIGAEVGKGIIGFRRASQYFSLLHLFLFAMLYAVATESPILMWVAIEATTLSTAFLISFYNKATALEAAWKYLIINSVGLLLGFFGTLLFVHPAAAAGFAGFITWDILFSSAQNLDPSIAKLAFIFILIGYGTKVGLFPMHTWLPDAHSKAPAPISGLLSGVLLNVAFLAVIRFKLVADTAIAPGFTGQLLILLGLLSIVVAGFIIFMQKNYKRLLAYSSIEHMGVIALGYGFGGAGTSAALLHMIYHALAKSALFFSAGSIFLKYSSTKIENVTGMLRLMPGTGLFLIAGFLAITGIPPFGIFITEFSILSAGMAQHPWAAFAALSGIILVFTGFLSHVVHMVFGEPPETIEAGEMGPATVFPVLALLVILGILSVYIPGVLESLLLSASRFH